ncbi:MAG TPA: TonB-dependent receptor, partial [Steroidobacteraceae bacterium]|nr:TonB-dependent receptor [Steroidobacteraceae bacterium]
MRLILAGVPAVFFLDGGGARAHASEDLSPIVVTATRVAESSFDIPASVDSVSQAEIRIGQLQENISESLMTVPGVSAESRQNYAQDLQLSVRGFGARSSFGVRGVRLYSDGIPGTMPDGQGQFSQFDLGSADRIEVLRGPFSALYGNSSGGVISIFTEDAPPGYYLDGTAQYGTFNAQRYALMTTGDDGTLNYVIDAVHFQTDGYRFHSKAERDNFNAKAKFAFSETRSFTLVANVIETPFIQDPMGLTEAQLLANRSQASPAALIYDTRKSLDQEQIGAIYDDQFSSEDTLSSTIYGGHRATTQFQSIPQATEEKEPLYPGGVIELDREFYGIDTHVTDQRTLAGTALQVVGGFAYDDLEETRAGLLNYVGGDLGVPGSVRLQEANHVYDLAEYLQAQWDPDAWWRLTAGVRNNVVEVSSNEHFPITDDPHSSVRYTAVSPVAGAVFHATPDVNLYASYGKGFETPTLNDLAYRSTDGSLPGLNIGLQPARSNNYEVGIKAGRGAVRADLAAFYIETRDELAVLQNFNGRSVEQNIGETSRHGAEASVDADWAGGFSGRLAYTFIRAVVGQAYQTCVGTPCLPATVAAGSYLPAVARNALYAGVTWRYAPLGFSATLEEQARARIYADDRNTASAPGYWETNFHAGFDQQTGRWQLSEFLRLDNLTDRAYVGSVIVNESNSRYFEPAPGRTAYVMF